MLHPKSKLANPDSSSYCNLWAATGRITPKALREFDQAEDKHACAHSHSAPRQKPWLSESFPWSFQFRVSTSFRAYLSTVQGKSKGRVHYNTKHQKRTSGEMAGNTERWMREVFVLPVMDASQLGFLEYTVSISNFAYGIIFTFITAI